GPEFAEILDDVLSLGPLHAVCFTGDLADWGLAEEYVSARSRLANLLAQLAVPAKRFFAVPGNHDIDRTLAQESWRRLRQQAPRGLDALSTWMARAGPTPAGCNDDDREAVISRSAQFWYSLHEVRGDDELAPTAGAHGSLGY